MTCVRLDLKVQLYQSGFFESELWSSATSVLRIVTETTHQKELPTQGWTLPKALFMVSILTVAHVICDVTTALQPLIPRPEVQSRTYEAFLKVFSIKLHLLQLLQHL